ncbi:MAG: hypothetical protein JNJ47_06215, partial [Alphaproteobacteria bacterium]|nr:hypothetical protein [Alphaproteobacteria bacterium]
MTEDKMFNENKKTLKKLKYVLVPLSTCFFSLEAYAKDDFYEGSNLITHRAPIPAKKSQRTWDQMEDDKKAQGQMSKERLSKFSSVDKEKKYNAIQEGHKDEESKAQGRPLAKSIKSDAKVALPNTVTQGEDARPQRQVPVGSSSSSSSLTSSDEPDSYPQTSHQNLGGLVGATRDLFRESRILRDEAERFAENAKIKASRQALKKKNRRSLGTEQSSKGSATKLRELQRQVPVGSSSNSSSLTPSGVFDPYSQTLHQKPAASRGGTAGLRDETERFAENVKIEASRQALKKKNRRSLG